MPSNKDLKRVVRRRMKKTGESYTAARAKVFDQREKRLEEDARYAAPRSDWPALGGQSDAVMKAKTGATWAEWVATLDADRAHELSHTEIARSLSRSYPEVSGWWVQTIAVGYERIRGLRDIGQRRDGAYEANKSRTYSVDVGELYRMFKDSRRRERWLTEGFTRIRTFTENKSMRIDWSDGTQVNLYFASKGSGKSSVAVQHTKLTTKGDVTRAKAEWQERLDALRDALH